MIRLDILVVQKTKYLWSNLWTTETNNYINHSIFTRWYGMKSDKDRCRRAVVDIPPDADPDCPQPCIRQKKPKKGILHKIKLKVIEGGTNFGTPFRRVQCTPKPCEEVVVPEAKALPPPEKKVIPIPEPRPGLQVSILGADTAIGHYVALLLKQCPCIKKLRLYEAKDTQYSDCSRDLCKVVQDLQHIDTNCRVQAFSSACYELERCLQNTDIVLMLESGYLNVDMPFEKRFCCQAPIVKHYADAIANECPKAFIIVCATPIDCMVPLVAETLKETSWYDPRKLLGSLAVPEMRASTLAARALCLEPRYTRVPCVGGTEGMSLVPLFSKAVEYFDFAQHNAQMMTNAVREAQLAVTRCDGSCIKAADLSEAHALAGLVKKVAYALMCQDLSRVTGFVETDASQVISPARYIANTVEIGSGGIVKSLGLPKMTDYETTLVDLALNELFTKQKIAEDWYCKYCISSCRLDACQFHFFTPKSPSRLDDCAYANL
ncbi:malate dehydrogenase, mitochondrial-like isoform X2 [Achroia grisella]|uniref:malate dehydrogenase, mitochondrial-like isoform X2 n=1 Tax=Achroia grisella TaxID=688607 RepID=UPI0027D20248|nr:malate dehydrogenase, mitochondrial-like isoform X2 [Achroia grisella]